MTTIRAIGADITTIGTEAIVNAANTHLAAGSGVCGAIFSAAGHRHLQTACSEIGHCPTGSAVATAAFDLEQHGTRHIIHAVGPVWNASDAGRCDELLTSAYRSTLRLAESLNVRTIAIPGISTGVYGFPTDRAANLVAALLSHEQFDLDEIVLVTLGADGAALYAQALVEEGLNDLRG